jgi:D-alanine-D-alanine ligase
MQPDPAPVLILYNTPAPGARESEAGILAEVEAVTGALQRLGVRHHAIGLRDLADLPAALYRHPAHIAINLVEGFQHDSGDMTLVPAVCRALGVEVTGGDTPCLSLGLDKWKTKSILTAAGIPCPAGVLVPVGRPVPASGLPAGLCIVKPVAAAASEGIDAYSLADSESPALGDLVRQVHAKFNQPALIEEMVGRRELNVSVFQNGNDVQVLPLAEIDFSAFEGGRPRIVGYAAKWQPDSFEYRNTPRVIPAPVTPEQADRIHRVALSAWNALGCRDYARVDIRLDDRGEPVVLEVNPNPDISPDAGITLQIQAAGLTYTQFIERVATLAFEKAQR